VSVERVAAWRRQLEPATAVLAAGMSALSYTEGT
jgi:hypothetical protein